MLDRLRERLDALHISNFTLQGSTPKEKRAAMVKAFNAGTAVFMVEGLQLIIAILLMVLGVVIVVNSGKELFNKKKESAKQAA